MEKFHKDCEDISSEYGEPVIIMLAKTEIEDVLDGLEIGADDYMKNLLIPENLFWE